MKLTSIRSAILTIILAIIFATNGFAQTWPCAQYLTRQVPNGSSYQTNISYVYSIGTGSAPVTVTVAKLDTLLNASAIYNGYIWAWKQYTGTAQSGSGGQRLIKVNCNNLDSTVTPTLTGYSFSSVTMNSNAAFVDSNGIYYVINTATSGATSFVLSRINLTTSTPTLLTNLTVNLPSGSTVSSGGLGDLVYARDSVFAFINTTGLFQFPLPSTSTTSVTAILTGGSINRTIGSLFYINSDPNNVYGYGSANGTSTQDRLLKISTQTGTVTELTTSGIAVSQTDGAGCPATNFTQPSFFPISGTVYDDANGLTDNTVNGTGTNAGGLNAILIDASTGNTIAITSVGANGTYSFTNLNAGNYNIEITTNTATIGATAPTVALPAGWVSTGENLGTGAGSDGTINSILPLGAMSASTTNADFGVDQIPTANNVSGTFVNPGGTNTVQVPTLKGTDPEEGTFPGTGNTDTVVINTLPASGLLYYNGNPVVAGTTINNYNPTLLTFDPPSGSGTYTFTYSEIDGANQNSVPATVTLNFSTITISGNVFDDANGLTDNTVNGVGTNAGGLNAVLIDAASGNVVALATVAANGAYSFSGLNADNYNEEITTNTATIGSTAPAVALPAGWVSIGENLGSGAGSDGTVNSILPLGSVASNITNANFGIEQLPASNNKTYTIVAPTLNSTITLNGTGTTPGPLAGSDPEDGTLGSTKTVIITAVPTNSQLYYNGILVTNNTIINNYNPSQLQITFTSTTTLNTSFQYAFEDAAGNQSTSAATYYISWTSTLPVVLTNFTAVKQNDYSLLNWSTSSELNVKDFTIERSIDNGKTWQTIGDVIATGNSSTGQNYSFTDDNPENGSNLYRLQIVDNSGSFTYSSIAQIEVQDESLMNVFPNPVGEEEALNIQLTGLKAGAYKISMVSTSGQTVKAMTFNITNSGSALLVIPTGNIPRGTYIIILNGNNEQYTKTVVVANR